jgi:hypothetical protein
VTQEERHPRGIVEIDPTTAHGIVEIDPTTAH